MFLSHYECYIYYTLVHIWIHIYTAWCDIFETPAFITHFGKCWFKSNALGTFYWCIHTQYWPFHRVYHIVHYILFLINNVVNITSHFRIILLLMFTLLWLHNEAILVDKDVAYIFIFPINEFVINKIGGMFRWRASYCNMNRCNTN